MPTPDEVPLRTSALLVDLAHSGTTPALSLAEILARVRSRAWGVLLVLVLVPAFIPLPIGAGGISGPLTSLIGLQMLVGLAQPWLPRRVLRREIRRSTLAHFANRMQRILGPIERACRPRIETLMHSALARAFSGVQLLLLGVLLALPIPLTNYPFALLLLLYAIAFIERDGVLLLLAWFLGCGAIIAGVLLSGEAVAWLHALAQ